MYRYPFSSEWKLDYDYDEAGRITTEDAVINNGSWDNFTPLTSTTTLNLTTGLKNLRVNAIGTNIWQWNLDKISLIKIETRKVAGINSEGLLVSEAEIGLGPDNETVLRLSDDYLLGARSKITKLKIGAKFTELFEDNDLLIEIRDALKK